MHGHSGGTPPNEDAAPEEAEGGVKTGLNHRGKKISAVRVDYPTAPASSIGFGKFYGQRPEEISALAFLDRWLDGVVHATDGRSNDSIFAIAGAIAAAALTAGRFDPASRMIGISFDEIAKRTGLSYRSVSRHVHFLEASSVLVLISGLGRGRHSRIKLLTRRPYTIVEG